MLNVFFLLLAYSTVSPIYILIDLVQDDAGENSSVLTHFGLLSTGLMLCQIEGMFLLGNIFCLCDSEVSLFVICLRSVVYQYFVVMSWMLLGFVLVNRKKFRVSCCTLAVDFMKTCLHSGGRPSSVFSHILMICFLLNLIFSFLITVSIFSLSICPCLPRMSRILCIPACVRELQDRELPRCVISGLWRKGSCRTWALFTAFALRSGHTNLQASNTTLSNGQRWQYCFFRVNMAEVMIPAVTNGC